MIDEIDRNTTRSEQLRKVYQHIEKQYYSAAQLRTMALQDKMYYVALRRGMHGLDAYLAWLLEVRSILIAI